VISQERLKIEVKLLSTSAASSIGTAMTLNGRFTHRALSAEASCWMWLTVIIVTV